MKKTIKYLTVLFLLTVLPIFLSAQNVGVNSTGATPTASSILDLNTGNTFTSPNGKGLLPPNVALTSITDAVTITAPATSLLVYNTATAGISPNNVVPGYYYWNGTKWVAFEGQGSNNWSLTGNAGTTVGTNFLGTTDANDFSIYTNNHEKIRVTSSGGSYGSVGIGWGITAPQAPLEVLGVDFDRIALYGPSNNQLAIQTLLDNRPFSTYGTYGGNGQNQLALQPMIGVVGIGNVAAQAALEVTVNSFAGANNNYPLILRNQSSGNTNSILFSNTNWTDNGLAGPASLGAIDDGAFGGHLAFYTTPTASGASGTPTEKMRILNNGNVGIGTTTPLFNLDVKGSERLLIFAEGTQTATDNANQLGIISISTFSPVTSTIHSSAVGGWGTFSPPAGVTITNAIQFYAQEGGQSGAGTITNGYGLYVEAPLFGTNRYSAYFASSVGIGCTNPTQALYVTGNIYATGTVLGGQAACSDVRWKKDFKPLNNSLNKIVQLSGYYYHFKTDEFPDKHFSNDLQIGMKAQEVEKLFPEILFTDKEGYKYLDYSRLTPILVEAMKEQQKIIDSQQAEINNLQVEINNLQTENKNFKTKYDNRLEALEAILTVRASK
jgi:hypothetical protein